MPFLVLFVVLPLIEIAVFVQVGGEIGLGPTLLLCLLTAVIGGVLVRRQGLQVLMSGRVQMSQGALPVDEIFSGICLLFAGALLMTPGFVTDAIGFSLLVPAVRTYLRSFLMRHGATFFGVQFTDTSARSSTRGPGYPYDSGPGAIDAEFERIDDDSR